MRATPRRAFLVAALVLLATPLGAQSPNLPKPSEIVEARAVVSPAPVLRGRAFEIAVIVKIRPGFHINAHEVNLDYLIPTEVEVQPPQGLRSRGFSYPPGVLRKFRFSPNKLLVYEGTVTVRGKFEASANAPLGPQKLALVLHFQGCNEELCLPPAKITVVAEFVTAPAGAPAQATQRK
jgi:DsbC/DsbD-like thiol-disulfide interchange protein